MKKLMLIILVTLFSSVNSIYANNWKAVSSPVNSLIYTISFVNDNVGFIGLEHAIYKTTNKGETWYQVYSGDLLANKFSFFGNIIYASCLNLVNNQERGVVLGTHIWRF